MAKKNVLILITSYWPQIGGAEIAVREITKRLGADFNFVILTIRHSRSFLKSEQIGGVQVYRLGLGCRWDQYFYPVLAFVKSFFIDFDLVYAVSASYAGLAALLINHFRGKEYVLNLQSGTLDSAQKRKKVGLLGPLYKQIHLRASKIHAISNALKERAERLGVAVDRIVVIPNGVALDEFKNFFGRRDACQLVAVARLETVKGIEYLIKAMPLIIAKEPRVSLAIAGDGSQRMSLEKLVVELGVADRVSFLGSLERRRVVELMNSGSVFVCPSLAEGFGIVCVEAMACGLAVVGANVGGIPDIIKHGVNGFLVKSANVEQIVDAVAYLLENPLSRERLAANALTTIEQYNWNKISQKVSCLFV
ncbi:MAG: glycosyltransferase family 4 protein [Patescibacteria group bacterium]